jgi:putative sigma-54 modulation protein
MRVRIKCIDIDVGDAFQKYLSDKLYKIGLKYNLKESADVILRLVKDENDRNKLIEIRIDLPGPDVFVKAQEEGFDLALKKALSALNRQLKKNKEVNFGHPTVNPLKL